MPVCFGFKWNISLSQGITRVITYRIDLLCLHLDNSELRLALSATRKHALSATSEHADKLWNPINEDWKGCTQKWVTRDQITISQTVCFYLHPEAPMINLNYNVHVQTFNFFKTWTISFILSAFENWKFKQSLTKMITRWITWQDFPLERKFYLDQDVSLPDILDLDLSPTAILYQDVSPRHFGTGRFASRTFRPRTFWT